MHGTHAAALLTRARGFSRKAPTAALTPPQGDVLSVAHVAGIQAAKQTWNLIPLCHPLSLSFVDVRCSLNRELDAVDVRAEARTTGPTGVEMEALTAAAVAGLTVYDMVKAVSREARIIDIRLESKSGGSSGTWERGG